MKNVLLFLTDGFEEIEAVATVDALRRGGVDLQTVSLTGNLVVTGSHGVPVTADLLFDQADFNSAPMLILPGGTVKINEHEGLRIRVREFAMTGKKVAAICAAPMVLGLMGLLKGKKATCYPGFEKYLEGADLQTSQAVVRDGNITTGRGPGLTLDFALALLEQLKGKEVAEEVARGLLLK